jgi:hypothetical protein
MQILRSLIPLLWVFPIDLDASEITEKNMRAGVYFFGCRISSSRGAADSQALD